MTSVFGSLPRVMCVLLDLFNSGSGPKSLDQEGNHIFMFFVCQAIVLVLTPMVPECVPAFVS